MPSLAELTDYASPKEEAITIRPVVETPTNLAADADTSVGTVAKRIADRLLGLNGQERYQLWPEKVVREALSAPHDVMTGETPQYQVDPVTGDVHTSLPMIEKAQSISALAGTGGLAGTGEGGAVLGATPSLRPALKYKDKLYKGKPGQEHQDVIPPHLYPEFQDMAMKGEDISHYNFGFVNDKGHFLNREEALKYGIDTGLIDPQAGKYGALTSTLYSTGNPGIPIEATYNDKKFKLTPVAGNPFQEEQK